MSVTDRLPTADMAAIQASKNYLYFLLKDIDEQILQAIEDGKYQILVKKDLDDAFDDNEVPYLEAKMQSYYGAAKYVVSDIKTSTYNADGTRVLTCRISWFPIINK